MPTESREVRAAFQDVLDAWTDSDSTTAEQAFRVTFGYLPHLPLSDEEGNNPQMLQMDDDVREAVDRREYGQIAELGRQLLRSDSAPDRESVDLLGRLAHDEANETFGGV